MSSSPLQVNLCHWHKLACRYIFNSIVCEWLERNGAAHKLVHAVNVALLTKADSSIYHWRARNVNSIITAFYFSITTPAPRRLGVSARPCLLGIFISIILFLSNSWELFCLQDKALVDMICLPRIWHALLIRSRAKHVIIVGWSLLQIYLYICHETFFVIVSLDIFITNNFIHLVSLHNLLFLLGY